MVLLNAGLAGCSREPVDSPALREQVLHVDPEFNEVLAKRDELANRIMVLERELALKRQQTDRQIMQLRTELKASNAQVKEHIDAVKRLLQPSIEEVELAMSLATEELQAMRKRRDRVGQLMSHDRKDLKPPPDQSVDANAATERELQHLRAEAERLDQEIAALTEHLNVLKAKRALLRL